MPHDTTARAQVGKGSYGVVNRATWRGADVAVKRFLNQSLEEGRMLEFRAEVALLSTLRHPNTTAFIGTHHTTHTTRHTTHTHTTHDHTTHTTAHDNDETND
jgi:serine/threonine protein kinase